MLLFLKCSFSYSSHRRLVAGGISNFLQRIFSTNLVSRLNPPELQPYIYLSERYNPGSARAAASKARGLSVQQRMVHSKCYTQSACFALHQ